MRDYQDFGCLLVAEAVLLGLVVVAVEGVLVLLAEREDEVLVLLAEREAEVLMVQQEQEVVLVVRVAVVLLVAEGQVAFARLDSWLVALAQKRLGYAQEQYRGFVVL